MKNKNIILMLNLAYYRNAGVFPKTIYIVAEITVLINLILFFREQCLLFDNPFALL